MPSENQICEQLPLAQSSQIVNQIRTIAAKQAGCELEVVTVDSYLVEDLGMDSLDVAEFTMQLEETFDIEISEDQMEGGLTIANVSRTVTVMIA